LKIKYLQLFSTSILKQFQTKKIKIMKEIKMNIKSPVINVSANRLWEIAGPGFADVYIWSEAVNHSTGSGESKFEGASCDIRGCDVNVQGFSKLSEKLDYYDADKKALSYQVLSGVPGFVKLLRNHWQIKDAGYNQSILEMNVTMQLGSVLGFFMAGLMKRTFNKTIPGVFRDLKVYAETGQVSEQKAARMKKLQLV
jgi:hypothetical protein